MGHPIHRVQRFEIVGPYTLVLEFDDGTQQRIDFQPVLEGELFGRCRICTRSTRWNWTRRSERFNGRTAQTSTRRRFTVGRSTAMSSSRWPGVGRQVWIRHPTGGLTCEWSRRATDNGRRAAHSPTLGGHDV